MTTAQTAFLVCPVPGRTAVRVNVQTAAGLAIVATVGALALVVSDRAHPGSLWLLGLAFGFALQRSRFCFASAFRDLFLIGHSRVMRGILAGLAVATVGFALIEAAKIPRPIFGHVPPEAVVTPLGINLVLGGLLFGIGMVLAGGCVSGSLYRVGEGYVASWVALGGVMLGLLGLAHTWNWWWQVHLSKMPVVWLPAYIGYAGSVALTLLLLLGAYVLLLWRESRSGMVEPHISQQPETLDTVGDRLRAQWRRVFVHGWPVVTGGVVLGVLNVFLYIVHMPWGVTGELGRWANAAGTVAGLGPGTLLGVDKLAGCTVELGDSFISHGLQVNVGLFAGSFAAALLAHEFKLRTPRERRRYVQSLGGGILMGYGAGLAVGCTIGAFFSAIPSLGLNGWLFAPSLALGAFLGVKLLRFIP